MYSDGTAYSMYITRKYAMYSVSYGVSRAWIRIVVTRGNSDLVFALMITIITYAKITPNQNDGFA